MRQEDREKGEGVANQKVQTKTTTANTSATHKLVLQSALLL